MRIQALASALWLAGCGSSTFAGGNGKASGGAGAKPSGEAAAEPAAELPDAAQKAPGPAADVDAAAAPCTPESDPLAFVLALDNSASTLTSDEAGVRRQAAIDFVQALAAHKREAPSVDAQVAVIGFARDAVVTSGGWVKVEGGAEERLGRAITDATSDQSLGTFFLPVFARTDALLGELDEPARRRRYLILLSDGEPMVPEVVPPLLSTVLIGGLESLPAIDAAAARLVKQRRAAVVTIAAGSAVRPIGQTIMRSLAVPNATKGGTPAGSYHYAPDADALREAWRDVFAATVECK